ncbi:prepilin-type N-terminal cleavage/methylation domain-containing protein [Elusimicrobium posterum]|uniref:type IV pilin protein n=1 Tax=Elusimicrobium posterum TaxID=3116653 RepID=UPI003C776AFB
MKKITRSPEVFAGVNILRTPQRASAGFTLIELLVVVLIIGILAAIALLQYTKAVEKSRAAEAVLNIKTIYEAQQRYFLQNGSYTQDLAELDVPPPGTEQWSAGESKTRYYSKYFLYAASMSFAHASRMDTPGVSAQKYMLGVTFDTGKIYCAWQDASFESLCKGMASGGSKATCAGLIPVTTLTKTH